MRLYRTLKIIFVCILLCYALPEINAQEQGYRWGKWSAGHTSNGSGNQMDNVVDSYIDSAGNTYIFGRCGMSARLGGNGPYINPMDSITGYNVGNIHGGFLAKIDTLGNVIWCRSARGNYQEASVMTFFYDSTLDMRRPQPCYAVDSLWCDRASDQTVILSWRSRFPHSSYELAYIPEDGDWGDATLMQISDTTAAVTLPDGRCHLFRIRGLCEGNRVAYSPWSSPVTVCPPAGISSLITRHSSLNVYPNPTDGTLQILGLPDERVTVEVMDMKGRLVKTFENTSTFNVSDLASGVYIVHVKTNPGASVPEKNIYLELVKK